MKVTVSFDSVRVVVPCGDGQMQVGELIEQAVSRYSKVKSDRPRVTVHYLKSVDGGILDPDDRLVDVVDDKDQLNASYELLTDCLSPTVISSVEQRQHGGGDGTSACGSPSEGAGGGPSSPDLFRAPIGGFTVATFLKAAEQGGIIPAQSRSGDLFEEQSILDLTSSPMATKAGARLIGPAVLPRLLPRQATVSSTPLRLDSATHDENSNDSWAPTPLTTEPRIIGNGWESVAKPTSVVIDDDRDVSHDDDDEENKAFMEFTRDPARKSLNNNVAMLRWLDAQERIQDRFQDDEYRKDPVGSSDEADIYNQSEKNTNNSTTLAPSGEQSEQYSSLGTLVILENPRCPLGIHVVPGVDAFQRNTGLVIHSIEPKSPVDRDGRLQVNDRIHEINGLSLVGLDFPTAQEVFKSALNSSTIRLRVTSAATSMAVAAASSSSSTLGGAAGVIRPTDGAAVPQRHLSLADDDHQVDQSPKQLNSLPKKLPPPVPERTTSAGVSKTSKFAPISSTRLIGHVTTIDLVKGSQGLGFSVTTRDNQTGGDSPIYVKNILPQGAAVVDGRLLPGDRLLQVNGADMTGKSQEDVVAMLRGVKIGDVVTLVISRTVTNAETLDDVTKSAPSPAAAVAIPTRNSPASPRSEKIEGSSSRGMVENIARVDESSSEIDNEGDVDYIVMSISVEDSDPKRTSLLGASIKGKTTTSENGSRDLGLFVKEIIKGSAAEKDGRLMPDDRLVELNGVSLVGRSNADTMKVLREALRSRGPSPGCVDLVVARCRSTLAPGSDFAIWESTPRKKVQLSDGQDSPSTTSNTSCVKTTSRPATATKSSHPAVLRNTSYYMANSDISLYALHSPEGADAGSSSYLPTMSTGVSAPTIIGGRSETFLIETEGGGSFRSSSSNSSSGRSSRNGRPLRLKRATPVNSATNSLTRDRTGSGKTKRPTEVVIPHDVTIESSDSSPVEAVPIHFSREGLGRQSMSEKRKGHLDPRVTAFYQQVKMARGNPNGGMSEDPLRPIGNSALKNAGGATVRVSQDPTTKLYRCCSLESVSMAPHILDVLDDDQHGIDHLTRNRGCNDSFRAAVDRSYVKGRNAAYSDKQRAQMLAIADDVDSDKKNGRKQRTFFQTFGEVFKLGKSRGNDRDKAEKAYSLRDAEVQKERDNIAREVAVSKCNLRPVNERLVGQAAITSPAMSVRRLPPPNAVSSAVGYVAWQDSCNSLPQQWSSPEYAVLAPHRGATNGGSCNCRVPCDCKSPSCSAAATGQLGDTYLQHTRTTNNLNIAHSQLDTHSSTIRTHTATGALPRSSDELRPYRPPPSDLYHSSSPSSLQRQQQRRGPATGVVTSNSPMAYQPHHPAMKPVHYGPGDGGVFVGQSAFSRPSNGVALTAASHREERNYNRQTDRNEQSSNSYTYDGSSGSLSGSLARQRVATPNGFAVAGNQVNHAGAAYKFSQPANV